MRFHLSSFLLIVVSLASPWAFGNTRICAELLSNVTVNEKIYRDIKYKEISNAESWRPADLYSDYSPNDIFIGIALGHTYFIVGDYRYDGGMGINGNFAKVRERNGLTPGAVLRIKNAPAEIVDKLNDRLSKGQKPVSLTCSQGVCSYLRGAGIDLPLTDSIVPSRFLEEILKTGIVTKDGQTLSFDLITLGMRDVEQSITYSRIAEAFFTAFGPVGYAATGAVLYFLYVTPP